MRISGTGKISDDFFVTGDDIAPIYLLDTPTPALFEGGYTALSKQYESEIKKILGRRLPAYLFLTHAHFDHVGAVSHLKEVWPDMRVAASGQSDDILKRPGAIQLIRSLNQEVTGILPTWEIDHIVEASFEPFRLDLTLKPGQTIELGEGCSVKALYTPGHTRDFMSYWMPDKKILIASEAVGCVDEGGHIYTEFLVDYDDYRKGMEMMARLEVQTLCLGHKYVLTGPEARAHIMNSLEQAADYVAMVEDFLYAERGDIDQAVARVKAREWDPKPVPKQPESAYVLNTRARVKTIRARMQRNRDLAGHFHAPEV